MSAAVRPTQRNVSVFKRPKQFVTVFNVHRLHLNFLWHISAENNDRAAKLTRFLSLGSVIKRSLFTSWKWGHTYCRAVQVISVILVDYSLLGFSDQAWK